MHELSIAQAILRIATAHADDARVTRIEVRVGHLRQVVPDALRFAFELSARGTAAEGAELALEPVGIAVRCRACEAERELDGFPLACPACGGIDVELLAGEELTVDSLELEHESPAELALAGGGPDLYDDEERRSDER